MATRLMEVKLKCVLLIDDDEINNFLHENILRSVGIAETIETAETVQDALELLRPHDDKDCEKPDLIFLDLNMPGLTGWDFIDEYKKLKTACNLTSVIVVLTTSVNPDDGTRASRIGEVAEFRNKPLTDKMVDEIVQKYFVA
jgi:CheY-like chemotaxis protein